MCNFFYYHLKFNWKGCIRRENFIVTHQILTAAVYLIGAMKTPHSYSHFSFILKKVLGSCKHIHFELGFIFMVTSQNNPSVLKFSLVSSLSHEYFIFGHVQNIDMEQI